jgi:hypothetical protein
MPGAAADPRPPGQLPPGLQDTDTRIQVTTVCSEMLIAAAHPTPSGQLPAVLQNINICKTRVLVLRHGVHYAPALPRPPGKLPPGLQDTVT